MVGAPDVQPAGLPGQEQMNVGNLLERVATRIPDSTATVFEGETLTFRQFNDRSNRFAQALLSLGIGKGDRVAILQTNSPRIHEAWFGALKIGVVVVNVNFRYSSAEVLHHLNYTESAAIVYGGQFATLIDSIRPSLRFTRVFICHEQVPGSLHYESLVADCPAENPGVQVDEDDLAGLHATGGTTGGRPKAAMMTHRNWLTCIRNYTFNFHPRADRDILLHTAPLTHMSGSLMFVYLVHGIPNVILPGFEAERFLRTIELHRVTTTVLVPTLIYILLDHPRIREYDLSSLETVVYGASPISPSRLKDALDTFGPVFAQGYGSTENLGFVSVLSKQDHVVTGAQGFDSRLHSAGCPVFDVDLKIVGPEGKDLPQGEIGEIAVRGDYMMRGYWKLPEETAQAMRDGWYLMGDMGYLDARGYLHIVDRKKNMIVTGGFNVYPREVEDTLNSHPAVAESCVIAIPDDKWGEAIHGVVVLKPTGRATARELLAFCRASLAGFKCPKSIDFIDDLPKNAAGKTLHREVREPYWKGAVRAVN